MNDWSNKLNILSEVAVLGEHYNTWISCCQEISRECGLDIDFENLQPCSTNVLKSELITIDKTQWKISIRLKPKLKLRTYVTFKADKNLEEYVKCDFRNEFFNQTSLNQNSGS
jgi:hypothetical protein